MAFILPGDPAVKDTTKASYAAAVNDALADLNSRVSAIAGNVLPNGSFEFDLDVDGEPDSWTVTDQSGGSHQISDLEDSGGNAIHGKRSLQIITTGANGRATALSDNFVPCGEGNIVELAGWVQRDTASIRMRAQIVYYDETQTLVSTDTKWDNSDTGTGWVLFGESSIVPNGAFFFKVQLIGGDAAGVIAGNVYFDGLYSSVLLRAGFIAGDYVWWNSGSAVETEGNTTPVKLYEIAIPKGGEIRTIFVLENTIPGAGRQARGRIYRNGIAIGTQRNEAFGPTDYSEDIDGWSPGDLLQIYGWVSDAISDAQIDKVRLCSSIASLGGLPGSLDGTPVIV